MRIKRLLVLILVAIAHCFPSSLIAQNSPSKSYYQANPDSLRARLFVTTGEERLKSCIQYSVSLQESAPDSFMYYAKKSYEFMDADPELAYYRSETHYHLGEAYHNVDDFSNALKHYHLAMDNFPEEDKDHLSFIVLQNVIGLLYFQLGNNEKAIESYQSILESCDTADYFILATMYNNIGGIFFNQKDFEKAAEYFEQSLSCKAKTEEPEQNYISVYSNIGTCYRELERYPESIEYLMKAIQLAEAYNDYYALSQSYQNLAGVYLKLDRERLAIEYLQKAEAIIDSFPTLTRRREVYHSLAQTYKHFGRYEQALKYIELEDQMKDSINYQENEQEMAALESQYKVEKQSVEIEGLKKEFLLSKELEAKQKAANAFLIGGLVLALLLGGLVLAGFIRKRKDNNLIKAQKEIVEEQKLIVETQKEEILDSIKYARQLQDNTLPRLDALSASFSDHFVLYLPKDIVSGDFYWVGKPPGAKSDWVIFGVGDCTGHGVPGALLTMMAQNYFQTALYDNSLASAGAALGFIDNGFKTLLSKEGSAGQNHGMDAALCAYNIDKGELHYAGARNPLVVLRDGKMEVYKGDKRGIGEMHEHGPFLDQQIQVEKGDILYMFSDGFVDQFGGERGKKLKFKAFKELMLAHCDKPMAEQKEVFSSFYQRWKGNLEQIDDVCVLGIKV